MSRFSVLLTIACVCCAWDDRLSSKDTTKILNLHPTALVVLALSQHLREGQGTTVIVLPGRFRTSKPLLRVFPFPPLPRELRCPPGAPRVCPDMTRGVLGTRHPPHGDGTVSSDVTEPLGLWLLLACWVPGFCPIYQKRCNLENHMEQ